MGESSSQPNPNPPTIRFSPALSRTISPDRHSLTDDDEASAKTPLLPAPATWRSTPQPARHGVLNENAFLVVALVVLGILFGAIVIENKTPKNDEGAQYLVKARNGVVSSDIGECSQIGVDVMKAGGNAVDAVIAAGVCIGTVNMYASGIGGGGFMVVRMADGTARSFNFREMAPGAAHRDMYEGRYNDSKVGGLAVGVPGELHGLATAHREFGALPWASVWNPSIALSRKGFHISPVFEKIMNKSSEYFLNNPEDWEFLFRKNSSKKLIRAGDKIQRPSFADTLEIIAGDGSGSGYEGVSDFYNGTLAKKIVSAIQAAGGIITLQDMASYFTEVTEPVNTTFLGNDVLTCPPPCSGPVMLEGLNIVEELPMAVPGELAFHYLVESMKWLSAGRTELGDPMDPIVVSNLPRISELTSKSYADSIRLNISAIETYDPAHYHPSYEPNDPAGTSHISALDRHGNAASLTTTVNLYWGAKVHDPVTGIIFNSQMDDFSIPGISNSFDLRPSIYNYILPRKRPLSSSAPTIVVDPHGHTNLVIGASGGSRIVTGVFETIVKRFLWGYDVLETVRSPRVHHQLIPNVVSAEMGVKTWVVRALQRRGHEVIIKGAGEAGSSVMHVIAREGERLFGMADWWRKGGKARGY